MAHINGAPASGPLCYGQQPQNAVFSAPAWPCPVSYTHLDVYKRQVLVDQFSANHNLFAGVLEGIAQQIAQGVGHGFAVEVDVNVFWQFFGVDRNIQLASEQADGVNFIG